MLILIMVSCISYVHVGNESGHFLSSMLVRMMKDGGDYDDVTKEECSGAGCCDL